MMAKLILYRKNFDKKYMLYLVRFICFNSSICSRGKFGIVYRCKDKVTGLMLAAKVVNIVQKEDRRAVQREVEIMRRLQHPRLIQLYDAIDAGKQIYVILELYVSRARRGVRLERRALRDYFKFPSFKDRRRRAL